MDFVNKYTEIGEHKNTFLALPLTCSSVPHILTVTNYQICSDM